MSSLLRVTDDGLFCEAGGFHIDPWRPVDRAVITHAHADHARWGSRHYLGSREGERVLTTRVGRGASSMRFVDWRESIDMNGVRVSLHPAGHILGSAQIRVEHRGEVWVVSGDYKTEPDATCSAWEAVRCHTFVTESTFGLPIYHWPAQTEVYAEVNAWWRANRDAGKASLLLGYALGKAQRLLSGLDPEIGPIYTHGSVERLTDDYRATGIPMPPTTYVAHLPKGTSFAGSMIVAPPSADGTPWTRKFGPLSNGFASGWMRIRGARRRRSVDRGFVLSDHVDWPSLLASVDATGAQRVLVTHGYIASVVRFLRERGLEADGLETRYQGERADLEVDALDPDTVDAEHDGAPEAADAADAARSE